MSVVGLGLALVVLLLLLRRTSGRRPRRAASVEIEEVAIDAGGTLRVRPALPERRDFAFVYRAALGVAWDVETRALVAPVPRRWTYAEWFDQIRAAVASEYGVRLTLGEATRWTNVPPELRAELRRLSEA